VRSLYARAGSQVVQFYGAAQLPAAASAPLEPLHPLEVLASTHSTTVLLTSLVARARVLSLEAFQAEQVTAASAASAAGAEESLQPSSPAPAAPVNTFFCRATFDPQTMVVEASSARSRRRSTRDQHPAPAAGALGSFDKEVDLIDPAPIPHALSGILAACGCVGAEETSPAKRMRREPTAQRDAPSPDGGGGSGSRESPSTALALVPPAPTAAPASPGKKPSRTKDKAGGAEAKPPRAKRSRNGKPTAKEPPTEGQEMVPVGMVATPALLFLPREGEGSCALMGTTGVRQAASTGCWACRRSCGGGGPRTATRRRRRA
jgi:hypothetical protein